MDLYLELIFNISMWKYVIYRICSILQIKITGYDLTMSFDCEQLLKYTSYKKSYNSSMTPTTYKY